MRCKFNCTRAKRIIKNCDKPFTRLWQFAVVFRIPAIYRARLMDAGIDFAKRHGTIPEFLPIPAAFVIDRDGRVAWRFANVEFTRRADPGRILTALRRLVTPDPE